MNNDERDIVPILVPDDEGSQNRPSNTPLTSVLIYEMKVAGLKVDLKSSIIGMEVIQSLLVARLDMNV